MIGFGLGLWQRFKHPLREGQILFKNTMGEELNTSCSSVMAWLLLLFTNEIRHREI